VLKLTLSRQFVSYSGSFLETATAAQLGLVRRSASLPWCRRFAVLIAPHYIWHPETRFCARNAAAGYGSQVVAGMNGFQSLFAPSVAGAYSTIRYRGTNHLQCSPTDDQAEILIKSNIPLVDILGVVVKTEAQAKNEIARLRHAGVDPKTFRFVIAPVLLDKYKLSSAIRLGRRPAETNYKK
jgi:ssDNA thymidine ADP-ribosyltransferase DarT-like protein